METTNQTQSNQITQTQKFNVRVNKGLPTVQQVFFEDCKNRIIETFKRRNVKLEGELKQIAILRDGNLLCADNVHGFNRKMYKVTREAIKRGKFVKGKFRFSSKLVMALCE